MENRTAVPAAEPALEAVPAAVWRVAGVVVFGAVMSMLDTPLVNVGLNTIATDLGAALDSAQWIASGYLLALAVALPLVGWLGRRFGLDRVWLGALVGFTITSGLCALAPNIEWLIALRIAQGLTAGLLVPAGQAMIGQVAGPQRLGRVMSVVLYRCAAAGPSLDAGFRQAFWWLTGATVISLAASIWLWYTEIRPRSLRGGLGE